MKPSIALGFGDNIDYEIIWNTRVIEHLIVRHDIRSAELDINRAVACERDLVISILGFLKMGSGGERFVSSSSIIEAFAQHFEKKITLGGTSVRAAIAMRQFGYRSALHLVTLNDDVRRLIPPDSPYVCSSAHDSAYPHLIVQFPKDARVQVGDIDLCASQSNRIIYHCDADNIAMKLNEGFADLITGAKVLLISGFNAMQSEALLTDRLETLLRIMESLPEEALVFYEDAGFYEPAFSLLIYRALASRIDIFSLNEDELQAYLKRRLDLLDVAQIRAALAEVQTLIAAPTLVVHTSNWALACGEGAARFAGALTAGVTMATTRFCYSDDLTVEHYREVEQLAPSKANASFAAALNSLPGDALYCVPVAQVDPPNPTTIGLGDAFVGGFLSALAGE